MAYNESVPFTYLLRCADGSPYVGGTWDIDFRLEPLPELSRTARRSDER